MIGEIPQVEAPCDNFTPANVDGRCEHCGDSARAHELATLVARRFAPNPDKRSYGLFGKFFVERTDGRSEPGEKHHGCDYFVLDLTHDQFAPTALASYADACRSEYPQLSADLDIKAADAVIRLAKAGLATPSGRASVVPEAAFGQQRYELRCPAGFAPLRAVSRLLAQINSTYHPICPAGLSNQPLVLVASLCVVPVPTEEAPR